jgi:hypothetical protein
VVAAAQVAAQPEDRGHAPIVSSRSDADRLVGGASQSLGSPR